jgi:hypothetical protein
MLDPLTPEEFEQSIVTNKLQLLHFEQSIKFSYINCSIIYMYRLFY